MGIVHFAKARAGVQVPYTLRVYSHNFGFIWVIKWPKLEELHYILFQKGFDNAHNSMADTEALKRCFFEALKHENAKKALLG